MQEFFHMGGYAFYVWTSFALSLLGLVYLYIDSKSYLIKKRKEVALWLKRQEKSNK